MQMSLTEEQDQFRDIVGRFLSDHSDTAEVRRQMESDGGYNGDAWAQLSSQLGLPGTHIDEDYGGFGFGPVELGIVMEAMGRHLYTGPFMASAVMAGYAILGAASEDQKRDLLPGIASGETIAALALDDWNDPDGIGKGVRAEPRGDGHALGGEAMMLAAPGTVDLLIVAARTGDALSLFALDAAADGVEMRALDVIDRTRRIARVALTDAPARLLGAEGEAGIAALWDRMSVMLAYEMIGGAEALFRSTVDYMKMRVQFGRPIASFQALKHRSADLLVDLELAKAATYHAGFCLASGEGDAYAPNMAKAMAGDAYMRIAQEAIQLRGGIGFTWEDDTHLWFKRAKSSELLLGSSYWHRERMMQRMEEGADGL